jgi:hypothetical protein
MTKVSIEALDAGRVDSIVRKHGRVFTVLRQANANDFIGAGFMSGINEFIGIACECHTPAHFFWVHVNEADIKPCDEQGRLEF